MPWLCLGLLFYIPGVYLEFPADPWHHFTKINEWSWVQTVTAHSTWKKSSYFLAYSFIGKITPPALQMNDLALVPLSTSTPIYVDSYKKNRQTGSLILIDASTHATVAAGMIL